MLSDRLVPRAFSLLLLALLLLGAAPVGADEAFSGRAQKLLGEVDRIIRDRFYDPALRGLDWTSEVEKTRRQLAGLGENTGVTRAINQLLARLQTSHTALFVASDPFYYFIASTFGRHAPGYDRFFGAQGVRMPDAGLLVETHPEGVFVQSVFEGGPADRAGVRVGDRIVEVAGGRWMGVDTFRGRIGQRVRLRLERQRGVPPVEVTLIPRLINPQEAFLQASRASARTVEQGGKKVGYYHVWAVSDPRIDEQFEEALQKTFRDCDGLVLDLREGIGGGYRDLLNPFIRNLPSVEFIDRKGHVSRVADTWTRPLVVLVNERSRSAKELYAYALKKKKLATLVGTRTAGAVTAGSAFYLSNGSLLYVAVAKVMVDGQSLEGKGVAPDIEVARPIPWSNGHDPQLERALKVMAERLGTTGRPVPATSPR